MTVNIIVPSASFASSRLDEVELSVTVDVGAAFPDIIASEESMRSALSELSRDDALFFCARVNAIISGFDGTISRANTLDHCPSLIMVDPAGVGYFEERAIPFLLIPACGTCNNDIGTAHVFGDGRVVRLDWRALAKYVRANHASKRPNIG